MDALSVPVHQENIALEIVRMAAFPVSLEHTMLMVYLQHTAKAVDYIVMQMKRRNTTVPRPLTLFVSVKKATTNQKTQMEYACPMNPAHQAMVLNFQEH